MLSGILLSGILPNVVASSGVTLSADFLTENAILIFAAGSTSLHVDVALHTFDYDYQLRQ